MRILIVNTYFYPETVGGTETLLLSLEEEYVRREHDVTVYCLEGTGRELLRENIRGIRVFRGAAGKTVFDDPLSLIGRADRWLSKAYHLRIGKEMETVLDEFSPDVVHTNNLFYMSTRVWKIAYDRHIPVVHTLHDYYLMTRDTLPFRLLYRFHRLNVKYISCFTGPSSVIVREFVEDGLFEGRTGLMIPNGIPMDREMFRKYRAQKLERSENDPIVFLYAGQLTKEKGSGRGCSITTSLSRRRDSFRSTGSSLFRKKTISRGQRPCLRQNAAAHGICAAFRCAGHGIVLTGESPVAGNHRQA